MPPKQTVTRARTRARLKASRGRPTAYRDEYARQGALLCTLGGTNADLAKTFGVTERTICRWMKAKPQFCHAIVRGKLKADAEVAEALHHRARGYSHPAVKIFMPANATEPVLAPYTRHYPPDSQAAWLWLRNRQPAWWRDKVELEHTGKNGGPIRLTVTAGMTPEDASRIYRERLRSE